MPRALESNRALRVTSWRQLSDRAASQPRRLQVALPGATGLRLRFEADIRWLNHYGFRPLDIPSLLGGLSG